MSFREVLAFAALAWAVVVTCVSLESIRRAFAAGWLARRRAPSPLVVGRRAVLLRPCHGDEPSLEENLASVASAHKSFNLRVIALVASRSDGATEPVERATLELTRRGVDATVKLTAASGANMKAAQLAVGLRGVEADLVLVADSDVDLDGVDLDALVAPIASGHADATWAPPVEIEAGPTLGDLASSSVLGASLHAFPLLSGLDPGGMVGKLFAIDRRALDRIGGFGALVDVLGEDMELARRLAPRVVVAPLLAPSRARHRSVSEVVARFARWLGMIRAQRPMLLASYPLLFCATPAISALAVVGAGRAPVVAASAVALAWITRLSVAHVAARATRTRGGVLEAMLGDMLLFAAFLKAISSRSIQWRGRELSLDREGRLRAAVTEAPRET